MFYLFKLFRIPDVFCIHWLSLLRTKVYEIIHHSRDIHDVADLKCDCELTASAKQNKTHHNTIQYMK